MPKKVLLRNELDSGHRLALVCSARSGDTKATGTTNLLLRAADEALQPSSIAPGTANDRFHPASYSASPPATPTSQTHPSNGLLNKTLLRTASSTLVTTLPPFTESNGADTPSRGGSPVRTPGRRDLASSVSSLRSLDDTLSEYSGAFHGSVDQIKSDHLEAARANVRNPAILQQLEEELEYECERLRSFLLAAQIIDEISLRSKDLIIGVGEKLSCRIVAAVLNDRGIAAEFVGLDSIVPKFDGETVVLDQAFYDTLADRLRLRLLECEDRIPVVTGFFGVVPGSLLTQIGRGYTDLCAALCAAGLQASELQIWKEVDGIFTADPRKVPTARVLPYVTPEEASELTYYGSEVIHPFTMEQVIRAHIPIRIKNVQNPAGQGTLIFPDDQASLDHASTDESTVAIQEAQRKATHRLPTAVTIKDHILVLNIRSNKKTISHGFFARTFTILDKHGIIVDLISTSEVQLSLSMHGVFKKGLIEKVVEELKTVGEVTFKRDMAILSLVGKQMKNMVGIAGRLFTVLAEGGINIEAISQGASEMNVSCVIERRNAPKALNLVHHHLLSLAAQNFSVPAPPFSTPLL